MITVKKKAFVDALALAARAAEPKCSMPLLSHALLRTEAGVLHVTCTDLYSAITVRVPCEGDSTPGGVPVKDLLDRVKRLPGDELRLETSDKTGKGGTESTTALSSGTRSYTLRGLPAADFPALMDPGADATEGVVATAGLHELLARAEHAISEDETRMHLNSLLFESTAETLRVVATDGHRLCRADAAASAGSWTALVARRTIEHLLKVAGAKGAAAETRITVGKKIARFTAGPVDILCKLVDARFPPYEQVIPAKSEDAVTVEAEPFAECVRGVAVAAGKTGGVRMYVEPDAGRVRLVASSPDEGKATDHVACKGKGVAGRMGLNASYLLDAVKACSSGQVGRVRIGYTPKPETLDPVCVRSADGKTLCVVMPIRSDWPAEDATPEAVDAAA